MKAVFFGDIVSEILSLRALNTTTGDDEILSADLGSAVQPWFLDDSNFVFAVKTVLDEPTGSNSIGSVVASLAGLVPSSPSEVSTGYAPDYLMPEGDGISGSDLYAVTVNNEDSDDLRVFVGQIDGSLPTFTTYSFGDFPVFNSSNASIIEYANGDRRVLRLPEPPENICYISTVIGAGALNTESTVALYIGMETPDSDAADILGLINTGRVADAATAYGTVTSVRVFYIYTWEGNTDGSGNLNGWIAGYAAGAGSYNYQEYTTEEGDNNLVVDQITWNGGFTDYDVVNFSSTAGFIPPPYLSYIVPTAVGEAGVFWTAFKRAAEQP